MKNPKKPTRNQAIFISEQKPKLRHENWLVVKDTTVAMHIVHRVSNKVRVLNKQVNKATS